MHNHAIILFLYLLNTYCAAAQTIKTPIRVFHRHIQSCHYVGTTEEDYVMELFDDSTLKITIYRTNYIDQYNSILRETFSGKYKSNSNTIEVKYLAHSIDRKTKHKSGENYLIIQPTLLVKPNLPIRWPSSVFILQANSILSNDNLFPELREITYVFTSQLESEFNTWDRLKVDKSQQVRFSLQKPQP